MSARFDHNINRLTEAPIIKALFLLALPIVLANALHTSHQLINTFWVGRLGADAVAAVSVSFPIIFLLVSLGGGLSVAGSILAAQYAGARDQAMVNHVAAQTLLMVLVVSAALSVLGYFGAPWLLHWMGIAGEAYVAEAEHYMRVSFLGMVFVFAFVMFQSILRGIGEVRLPLYVVGFSVLLNLMLDPLLIFGFGPVPAFGVAGAAWATLITQALAAVVGFTILFRGDYGVRLRLPHFRPDWAQIRRVFLLGLPASIEQSMQALGITVMTVLISSFGTLAIAAYGIGFRVLTFIIIPALGISMAVSTLVGQSLGAGDRRRAGEVGVLASWTSFWLLSAIGLILLAGARPVVAFFVPNDPALIEAGAHCLRFLALGFGLMGVQHALAGVFRGAGDTVSTMVLAIVAVWGLQFPLAWLLSKHTTLGVTGLWSAFPIAAVATAALAIGWFRLGRWQRLRLTEGSQLKQKIREEIIIEEGLQ